MRNILMAGFKGRLKYSLLIASVLMICFTFIAIVDGKLRLWPFDDAVAFSRSLCSAQSSTPAPLSFDDLIPPNGAQGSAQSSAPAASLFADLIPANGTQGRAQSNAPAAGLFDDLIPKSAPSYQGQSLSPNLNFDDLIPKSTSPFQGEPLSPPVVTDKPITVTKEAAVTVTSSGFCTGLATGKHTVKDSYENLVVFFAIIFLCVLVVFVVLNVICDLFTERHLGFKRLTTVLAVLSIAVVPTLYVNKAYRVEAELVWALMLISPLCVAAVLLYGRRLILWINEGFHDSK